MSRRELFISKCTFCVMHFMLCVSAFHRENPPFAGCFARTRRMHFNALTRFIKHDSARVSKNDFSYARGTRPRAQIRAPFPTHVYTKRINIKSFLLTFFFVLWTYGMDIHTMASDWFPILNARADFRCGSVSRSNEEHSCIVCRETTILFAIISIA